MLSSPLAVEAHAPHAQSIYSVVLRRWQHAANFRKP